LLSTLETIVYALDYLIQIINLLILVRVILSWFQLGAYSSIGNFIYQVTEPIMAPVRSLISRIFGSTGIFDFTPFATVLLINSLYHYFLRGLIIRLLFSVL